MRTCLLLLALTGCWTGSDPAPAAPTTPPPTAAPPPRDVITSACIVNSSSISASVSVAADGTRQEVRVCGITTECVAHPGNAGPGDGLVSLICKDQACACKRTTFAPEREETIRFDAPACHDQAEARALLVQHCLRGTPLAPAHTAPEPPPPPPKRFD